MDLERFDEALRFWGATDFSATAKTGGLRLDGDQVLDFGVIYDAARAYRDLLANGERVDPDYEAAVQMWWGMLGREGQSPEADELQKVVAAFIEEWAGESP